jgi:hypothetical protein
MIKCEEVKSWTFSSGERLVLCDHDECAKHIKLRRAILCGDGTIATVRPVRDRDLSESLLRQQQAAREDGDDRQDQEPIKEHDNQAQELGTDQQDDSTQEVTGELSWQSLRGTTRGHAVTIPDDDAGDPSYANEEVMSYSGLEGE